MLLMYRLPLMATQPNGSLRSFSLEPQLMGEPPCSPHSFNGSESVVWRQNTRQNVLPCCGGHLGAPPRVVFVACAVGPSAVLSVRACCACL